jgi:glycine reductase complex component B subunit alpha and beta
MGAEYRSDPLSLATFDVRDVIESTRTAWVDGQLLVDLTELAAAAHTVAPALADVTVHIVRPGQSVRVANVLDALLADVKADAPESTFPGALGPLSRAGAGRTHRLGGLSVLSVCDFLAAGLIEPNEYPDSYVDMAGPGGQLTAWGEHPALVVVCIPRPGATLGDVDRSIRKAVMRVARDVAAVTIGHAPDREESFELDPAVDPELPCVAVVLQVASEGPLTDTFLYGGDVQNIVPTLLDHRAILDGALTNGAYDWPAVRNVTAAYQDNALIRSLVAQHGSTLRFAGVILALGYLDTAFEKERSALIAASLCREIGADAVICTTFSAGNSHTDTMLTVRACEGLGIASVAIISEENGGLTDHVPEADSIISTGNIDELVDPWSAETVIGAMQAKLGEPVPLFSYLGACDQTGSRSLTAALA